MPDVDLHHKPEPLAEAENGCRSAFSKGQVHLVQQISNEVNAIILLDIRMEVTAHYFGFNVGGERILRGPGCGSYIEHLWTR